MSTLQVVWRICLLAFKITPRLLMGSVSLSILGGLLPYVELYIMAQLINDLSIGEFKNVYVWSGLFLGSLFLSALVGMVQGYISNKFRFIFMNNVELLVLQVFAGLDLGRLEDNDFQELVQKSNFRGVYPVYGVINAIIGQITSSIGIVAGAITLALIDYRMMILALIAGVPYFIVNKMSASRTYWIWDSDVKNQRYYYAFKRFVTEVRFSVETIIMGAARKFIDRIERILGAVMQSQIKLERKVLVWEFLASIVFFGLFALSFYLLIAKVIAGVMLIGTLTFALASYRNVADIWRRSLSDFARVTEDVKFAQNILTLLDTEPVLRSKEGIKLKLQASPEIVFEDVWFTYPGSVSGKYILKGINLTIKASERVSLVGLNQAGKTTLIKLLLRVYDPTKGRILVDGQDLREIDITSWYEYLGVLLQEYNSYYGITVEESIAISEHIEIESVRVQEAAKRAQAFGSISGYKDTFKQILGREFDGEEPSVGGYQRLALARAYYRRAHVLILDEPTAAVDALAEAAIFSDLAQDTFKQTAIIISHRFSTVRQSRRIVVLKDGSIIEDGSHEKLLALGGHYAELYNKQKEGYID